ncbi:MAG: LysR family transcriptional regulator [Magnetospirillum sp.]|nr:LysR family transcriptional regulator [Magnetospirillum sp.]
MDIIEPLKSFVRVFETKSFSIPAREARTSQPTISRQIAALEARLGTRLFARSTRALTPTEAGVDFYAQARRVLETLAEAEASVAKSNAGVVGILRLACPVAFGRLHVVPRLGRFMRRHPALKLDLVLSDQFVDLVEEGVDLSIRVGEVKSPDLIAQRIGETRRVALASPDYLAQRGTPQTPRDLGEHDCIVYTRLATGARWHFGGPGGPWEIEVDGRFRANNSEAVREAILAGLGIGVVPVWLLADEAERAQLQTVLAEYEPARLPINAVYPSRRFVPHKVRAMVEFLGAEFRLDPLLSFYRA